MQTLSSSKAQSWLSWFLRGILVLGFLILAARLVDLQIIKGNYFKSLAEGNRIRRVTITAPRGKILARGGEVMVGNYEVEKKVVFDSLEGYQKLSNFEETQEDDVITEPVRNYGLGKDFAHVSGYLGEIDEKELGKISAKCPEKGPRVLGDLIGRSGLEQEYDCVLSGIDGSELIEVDASGKKVRLLGQREPIAGQDIKTNIDYGLQQKIREIMESSQGTIGSNDFRPSNSKGAVIVADAFGEVLAFYSSPSFDPNIFVSEDKTDKISAILTDENLPLFNRVIGGKYHPGSIFKPIVAVAALEEGVIDKDYTFEDTGELVLKTLYGTFTYANWYFTQYGGVEGEINLTRAIARSTDTFFYKLGELTGIENLVEWSEVFGLDQATGIDLPGEIEGLIPSPSWKFDTKGEKWFLGNTYHMSIGQGDIALTPIGIHTAISTIANGGKLCQPKIVRREKVVQVEQEECKDLDINKESINLVKEGMIGACNQGGTGFTFFDFFEKYGIKVACKTGTAETGVGPHAWFTAFASASQGGTGDKAEIVVTVLVENGGEGSRVAGPIAREIFDYWFGDRN